MPRNRWRPAAPIAVMLAALWGAAPAQGANLMVVGDSISQGSSGDFTWRYRLWAHLQSSAPGAVDFVGERTDLFDNVTNQHGSQAYRVAGFDRQHHATWGRLLFDEKATVGPAIVSADADIVLVMLGINDIVWLSFTPAQVAGEMRQLVANARAARPGVDIVIGHLLARFDPWTGQVLDAAKVADVNGRFDALAAELSTSASRITTAATAASWLPKMHTWDGTHPNSTGEVQIAAAFADALARWGIGAAYGPRPASVPWPAAGRTPTAVPLNGAVDLSWPAVPGATGYLIEQKNLSLGEATFTRLPYPVGGTSWRAGLLAPGAVVEFRVVPGKGLMTGVAGPHVQTTVGGATPNGAPRLQGWPLTENTGRLTWTPVTNASGYYIWMADLTESGAYRYRRLPYAVPGTSFDPGLLSSGHWFAFYVVPVNGFIEGTNSNVVEFRTKGMPRVTTPGLAYETYFALGDSYSSGLGAADGGDYTGGNCLRTPNAWPFLMSFIGGVRHLACADEMIPSLYTSQLSAIASPRYSLVTVTIGGNDIGFRNELRACLLDRESCAGREAGIAARIDALRPALVTLYRSIRVRAPGADIVAVGYPLLVTPPGVGDCNPVIDAALNDAERRMIRRLASRLNAVVHSAALEAGGVSSAVQHVLSKFDGHEACSTSGEYINQTTGLIPSQLQASFHPNRGGQLAYALAVSDTLSSLYVSGMVRVPYP